MFRNYITVAVRNIFRHKVYSGINILGLTVGLTAVVLLIAYVENETGYDRFHSNREQLYRVVRRTVANEQEIVSTSVSGAVRNAALETIPQVKAAARVWDGRGAGPRWMRYGDTSLSVDFWLVEDNFLEVFDFPLQQGEISTLFEKPYSVAITAKVARKFFKDEDPIGKIVTLEHVWFAGDYTVTGILADPPVQSSLQFEVISSTVPTSGTPHYAWEKWNRSFSWIPVQTWLLLEPNAKVEFVEQNLNELMVKHLGSNVAATDSYRLQKLTRIHLYHRIDFGSRIEDGDASGGTDIRRLQVAIGIVLLLMLIASVNFTNLATARSLTRAGEAGVRKVVGASKQDLIIQYLTESIVLAFASLVVSIGVAQLVFPIFADMLETSLQFTSGVLFSLMPLLCLIALFFGVLAGLYPALFLSYLSPVEAIQPGYVPGSTKASLRMGLLTFQFASSVLLVIAASAMSTQMDFVRNKELGFQKEHVILLPLFADGRGADVEGNVPFTDRYETVKQAFLRNPNILAASAIHTKTGLGGPAELIQPEGYPDGVRMRLLGVDEDFLGTYGIHLVEGRNFDTGRASDRTAAFILNETAVRQLGWDKPIGMQVTWGSRKGQVIGVVRDFHNRSLHEEIGPVVLAIRQDVFNTLALRLANGDLIATINDLERIWHKFLPTRPFRYSFLDESLSSMYLETQRFTDICTLFARLATLVACLGMFGLISYIIERRRKEVAIRKVLGASDRSIVQMLIGAQIRPILYGNLIALPGALYFIDRWISDFVYRVDIEWTIYASGSMAILVLAIATVLFQIIRATRKNPVEALRHE